MGLDSVQLVLEIEKTFAVKIPDEVAERMATVGDVFDYILAQRQVSTTSVCLSSIVFFRLRRATSKSGKLGRFRPSDATASIMPQRNRRVFWQQLQNQTNLKLPVLQRPNWLVTLSAMTIISCTVLTFTTAKLANDSESMGILLAVVVAVTLIYLGEWVTKPWAIFPGRNWNTLWGLTQTVLALNFATLSAENQGANAGDIWATLRALIVEQLGVDPEEVHPSANFINDLGLD